MNVQHPLTLADGTKINTSDGSVIEDAFLPTVAAQVNVGSEAGKISERRKRLADLPAPPQQVSMILVVVGYELMGVRDIDITEATKLTLDQLESIRLHEAYPSVKKACRENILEEDTNDVRGIFVKYAPDAAKTVVNLSQGKDKKLALESSKDILDRAGHRPADVIEHRHKMEGGLTITLIRKDETKNIPILDLNADGVF